MEKEAIRSELKNIQEDIKNLRSIFSKKKLEKENLFSQGETYSKEIKAFYDEVKEIEVKNNLDAINADLDLKKTEFEEYKKTLNEFEIKFSSVRSNFSRENKPRIKTISSEKAKSEIKSLETKLQTQVLSLEKESEVIRKISDLKKLKNEVSDESDDCDDEFKSVKNDLRKIKKKYINAEKKIRSLYKQIRIISKEKKLKYKKIDELRDLKKKSFENFRSNKKDYGNLGRDLKNLFKKEEDILISLGESPRQRKTQFKKDFKDKQKEVEEKLLKKGGVITTEDLLVFQKK